MAAYSSRSASLLAGGNPPKFGALSSRRLCRNIVPHRTIGGRSEPVAQAPFQGVERLGAGFGRFPAIVERAFRGDLPTLVMFDWVILTLTPWVKVRAMDNPLLPCLAVLDANREVLRVTRKRECHLRHLVLCGHVIGEFTVQP